MPKENKVTFWESSTPPEDWKGLTEYIRPRNRAELVKVFGVPSPLPPQPPDLTEPPPSEERSREPTLLEQLRLPPEEFVELALQQRNLWADDELDYLYEAAAEGEIDERLDELAESYFSGARQRREEPGEPTPAPVDISLNTSFDLPDLPGATSIPDLDALEGTANVDRWWEQKK